PEDVPEGKIAQDQGRLPAVSVYQKVQDVGRKYQVEVMFQSFLAHSGKELKRLLVAADAFWRAIDLGYLPAKDPIDTLIGQRGMLLLTLAGLLEFPADQNQLDGLWSMALKVLRLPEISRSTVRDCITSADHDADNYYGSRRGLRQLLETLPKSEPLAYEKLKSDAIEIGRAMELELP